MRAASPARPWRPRRGRRILAATPDSNGSLGIAISEAVEIAAQHDDTKYALGSVLNHVLLHQTVVGQEAMKQLEMADDYPDVIVGCTGGGSNFAGIVFPFLGASCAAARRCGSSRSSRPPARASRAASTPTTSATPAISRRWSRCTRWARPSYRPGFHAGGLRYHGMAPLVSHVKELGLIEAKAYHQTACFEAGVFFARHEGIVPAPEANHAVKGAIDEAMRCKEEGVGRTILFNLCGHGHFDMQAYMDYFRRQAGRPAIRRERAGDGAGGVAEREGSGVAGDRLQRNFHGGSNSRINRISQD